MGLGGYLAARGDAEHYASEKVREEREIVERTHDEEEEIYEIFEQYKVDRGAHSCSSMRSSKILQPGSTS